MRGARAIVLAAGLLARAVAAGAAETGATLETTKQELRQLQSDQKSKTVPTTADGLKLGTPALTMPLNSDPQSSPDAWLASRLKQERKLERDKEARKNWLVDGVEKLGKDDGSRKDAAGPAADDSAGGKNPQAIDQSDPQYLLKLFDEQKKSSGPKATAGKPAVAPAADPFAPFLQGWLGSSPSRGEFFDQFVRKADPGGAFAPSAGTQDFRVLGATPGGEAGLGHEKDATAKPNPYLADLEAPLISRDIMAGGAEAASGGGTFLPTEGPKAPAPLPAVEPARDLRPPAKAPLPGLTDDKKYFPQLKKF